MKRVLHTFDSQKDCAAYMREWSKANPGATVLVSSHIAIEDDGTSHHFRSMAGPRDRERIMGHVFSQLVDHGGLRNLVEYAKTRVRPG